MHFTTLFTYAIAASTTGWAAYVLEDDYMDGDFFSKFSFWETEDPTHGFVAYQNQSAATEQKLIESTSNQVNLLVDSTYKTPNGRPSVRLTSNKIYQSGLVIIDVAHMPGSICGAWPAFWTVGPDWPNQGEIDIIEGVNDQAMNKMTLHTGPGCSIGNNNAFSGSLETTTCDVSGESNVGCQIEASGGATYGTSFNAAGGGVYAMDWTSKSIAIYFFPRGSIPSDVTGNSPNPSSWGQPVAHFSGGCDISSAFTNQQLVFDTTFCGDWAGKVWGESCAAKTGKTCEEWVANNPKEFKEAYWTINSLKVYQNGGGSSEPEPSAAPSSYAPPNSVPQSAPPSSAGQSSFQTVSVAPSSTGGWLPLPTSSDAVSSAPMSSYAPAPSNPAVSSYAPAPSSPPEVSTPAESSPGGWPGASPTWGGGPPPWESGGWGQHENRDGSYAVGIPAQHYRQHARHLRAHKMRRAGMH
ncbi:hypothetical protein LTR37_008671 [Vermiconidia calcicola]|uniref:Uncharacterized protein n=1 Tax=Vermiconidia calcicola TaxID=1690605 RepID=A0ACC3NAU7_9PEZI|nr:hypothetical protein LTR37_008671 [Vermiconidia calcicola]